MNQMDMLHSEMMSTSSTYLLNENPATSQLKLLSKQERVSDNEIISFIL